MTYLLDTNICVFLFRRKSPAALQRLYQTQAGDVGISTVTLAELRYGADRSGNRALSFAATKVTLPVQPLG